MAYLLNRFMTIDLHIFKSQTLKTVEFIRRIFKPIQIYKFFGKNWQLLSKNVIILLFESDI